MRLYRELEQTTPGDHDLRRELAYTLAALAQSLGATSRKEKARKNLEQARTLLQDLRETSALAPSQQNCLEAIEKALSSL